LIPEAAAQADAAAAPRPAQELKIGGCTPFTSTDYPGKLSAVVFVQGCPWRCAYCHNPDLQPRAPTAQVRWDALMELLERRRGLIDAVVFSGGEATLDPALSSAMRAVRALGFGVGLHTSGAYPRRLAQVLALVDWVGMDVKAHWSDYEAITGVAGSGEAARQSLALLLASGVDHECRTTLHPALHRSEDIIALGRQLQQLGVQHYALQLFRSEGCQSAALRQAPPADYPGAQCEAALASLFRSFQVRRG
jgi:anaerobic ribonucleoside-triphosphate reductase activating protein